ncbi:MAG: CDP-paratose 2-epimerase [Planctomycetota bacterium]|nr:MAG: CDP-paratose 2-epimerase [Planctomycetota bacterium]REK23181.1 MAG: CDP-paratose 2-epimerase [Planctomycetota bacterium]REK30901.1 MAG: CDP-paratose 2-epimerase [Planctomycetota bacterium]
MQREEGDCRQALWVERDRARGGTYRLHSRILLPREREGVFEFFSDAHKLESITPDWLQFKVLTPRPIEMQEGCEIDYRLRLHGIPIRWRSRISVWEPCERFVDEQVRGPYRLWRHEHRFEERPEGTLVTDDVSYSVPGGALMHRLFVGRDVRAIFEYRQRRLLEEFSGQGSHGERPSGSSAACAGAADG